MTNQIAFVINLKPFKKNKKRWLNIIEGIFIEQIPPNALKNISAIVISKFLS